MRAARSIRKLASASHTAGLKRTSGGSWARPQSAKLRAAASNQSVQQLLSSQLFQAKLTINQPDDQFEQEADRVSDQVMRMTKFGAGDPPRIQRMCAHCQNELEAPRVQRLCSECEEQMHRRTNDRSRRTPQVSAKLQSQIAGLRGGGQPLGASTRKFFEPRFGRDFSDVRIHEGSKAAETARSVNALAYTTGRDIVFAPSQYSPGTERGKRLLAHELTHTIQQGHARDSAPAVQRMGDPSKVPPGLSCPVATDSPVSSIVDVLFPNKETSLTPTQKRSIQSFAVSWNAAGASTDVRVDGYASPAGTDELNWRLSCERAQAVASELLRPTASGIPAVPSARLSMFAQGETSEFSRTGGTDPDAPNRRAAISSPAHCLRRHLRHRPHCVQRFRRPRQGPARIGTPATVTHTVAFRVIHGSTVSARHPDRSAMRSMLSISPEPRAPCWRRA